MPRELPRREIKREPETISEYHQKESALKPRGFENNRRWTGVHKEPVTLTVDAVTRYSTQFRTTVDDLKKQADFGGIGGSRAAEPLKQVTHANRGDLPGSGMTSSTNWPAAAELAAMLRRIPV
jgi:hypothetical protein